MTSSRTFRQFSSRSWARVMMVSGLVLSCSRFICWPRKTLREVVCTGSRWATVWRRSTCSVSSSYSSGDPMRPPLMTWWQMQLFILFIFFFFLFFSYTAGRPEEQIYHSLPRQHQLLCDEDEVDKQDKKNGLKRSHAYINILSQTRLKETAVSASSSYCCRNYFASV